MGREKTWDKKKTEGFMRTRYREGRERVCEIKAAVLRDGRVGHECSRSGLDG